MPLRFLAHVRALVFDFDGTLARTEIDFALMRQRAIEHIKSWGLWQEGMDQRRYVLELVDAAAAKLDRSRQAQYRAEAMRLLEEVEMLTCQHAEPFPGTAAALRSLAGQGYRLGIITRNCHRAVQAVLARHPLPHDVLLTRDDVPKVKPDKAHLLAALEVLAVTPVEALMVGDHPTDMACGKSAGAYACGVLTDRTPREELEAAGADLVVEDVPALARILCSPAIHR